jgi:replication initiation protein RepC
MEHLNADSVLNSLNIKSHSSPQFYSVKHDKPRLYKNFEIAQEFLKFSLSEKIILKMLIDCAQQTPTVGIPVWPSTECIRKRTQIDERQIYRALNQLEAKEIIRINRSPNGKRYAIRNANGQIIKYYGFDLAPILERENEFKAYSKALKDAEIEKRIKHDDITTSRQAITSLLDVIIEWDQSFDHQQYSDRLTNLVQRTPRRTSKKPIDQLHLEYLTLKTECEAIYKTASEAALASKLDLSQKACNSNTLPENLSCSTCPDDMHIEYDTNIYDQSCKTTFAPPAKEEGKSKEAQQEKPQHAAIQLVPVSDIKRACPRAFSIIPNTVFNHNDLIAASRQLAGSHGASNDAWDEAAKKLGAASAAAAVFIAIEDAYRAAEQGNPMRNWGGYFRYFVRKMAGASKNINQIIINMKLRNAC